MKDKKMSQQENLGPLNEENPKIATEKVATGEYTATITKDYYGGVDIFYLNKKDPNYQYRFLREKDENLTIKTSDLLFHKGGWQVCPKQHLLRIGIELEKLEADGTYRKGDTILAFMPKKLYEEKEAQKREKSKAPMTAINRLLKEGDASPSLGSGIHESMKGIQTREKLRMK